jgi:hypothetical protein
MVRIKNKKGLVGFTATKLILWFLFLIVVLMSVRFLVKKNVDNSIDTKSVESDFFYQEMIYTNDGISYRDPITGRNYPGIIDINKFNSIVANKSVYYGTNNYYIAANFSLRLQTGDVIGSFVYNEEWFGRWKSLTKTFLPGTGGAKMAKKTSYVLVRQNDKLIPAILEAEILYPNS